MLINAPWSINIAMASVEFPYAAKCTVVSPLSFVMLIDAPWSINSAMATVEFPIAAWCLGVVPSLFVMLINAPWSINIAMASVEFPSAAWCTGVLPSLFVMLMTFHDQLTLQWLQLSSHLPRNVRVYYHHNFVYLHALPSAEGFHNQPLIISTHERWHST